MFADLSAAEPEFAYWTLRRYGPLLATIERYGATAQLFGPEIDANPQ